MAQATVHNIVKSWLFVNQIRRGGLHWSCNEILQTQMHMWHAHTHTVLNLGTSVVSVQIRNPVSTTHNMQSLVLQHGVCMSISTGPGWSTESSGEKRSKPPASSLLLRSAVSKEDISLYKILTWGLGLHYTGTQTHIKYLVFMQGKWCQVLKIRTLLCCKVSPPKQARESFCSYSCLQPSRRGNEYKLLHNFFHANQHNCEKTRHTEINR